MGWGGLGEGQLWVGYGYNPQWVTPGYPQEGGNLVYTEDTEKAKKKKSECILSFCVTQCSSCSLLSFSFPDKEILKLNVKPLTSWAGLNTADIVDNSMDCVDNHFHGCVDSHRHGGPASSKERVNGAEECCNVDVEQPARHHNRKLIIF